MEVRAEDGSLHSNFTIRSPSRTLSLHNLTEGKGYTVQLAAINAAGMGPPSVPIRIPPNPDPDPEEYQTLDPDVEPNGDGTGGEGSNLFKETWFIVLIGVLSFLLLGALVFFLLLKRRLAHNKSLKHGEHESKEGSTSLSPPSTSRSRIFPHSPDGLERKSYGNTSSSSSDRENLWIDPRWKPVEYEHNSEAKLLNWTPENPLIGRAVFSPSPIFFARLEGEDREDDDNLCREGDVSDGVFGGGTGIGEERFGFSGALCLHVHLPHFSRPSPSGE